MLALKTAYQEILQENERILQQVDEIVVAELLERLMRSPRIFLTGKGRSGLITRCFAMRLMHLGLKAYVVDETITPAIRSNDLLIACSGSGETEETCQTAEKAQKIGAQVAVITADAKSRLALAAPLVVVLPTPHKRSANAAGHSVQYAGSLFEQSTLLFCDGVVLQAMRSWRVGLTEMSDRHTNLE